MAQKRKSLFTKLFVSYTAFVLLTALTVGGIAHVFAVRAYNEELEDVSTGTVRQFQHILQASILDRTVEIATHVATGSSTAGKLEQFFKGGMPQLTEISALYTELVDIVSENIELVESIHVYDLQNQVLLSSKLGVVYTTQAYGSHRFTHDWLEIHAKDHRRARWVSTRQSPYPTQGGPVLTYICSNPMSSPSQTYRGYIAVDIYERALREICSVLTEEAGASLYIADAEGRLLTHPDAALIGADIQTLGMPCVSTLSADASGSFAYQAEDLSQYACYSQPLGNGWRLILAKPTASFYQASRQMQGRLVLGCTLAILLGLLLAYWVTVRMYRPVRTLANAVGSTMGGKMPGMDAPQNEYAFIDRAIHSISAELSSLRRQLDGNRELVKSNLVHSLISNTIHTREMLRQRMALIREPVIGPWYNIIRLSLSDTLVQAPQYKDVALIKLNLCAWMEEMSDSDTLFLAGETRDDELVALVFSRERGLQETLEAMALRLQDQYQGHIRMSLGLWQEDPLALHRAYTASQEAAGYGYFHPEWSYCAAETTANAPPPQTDTLLPYIQAVSDALRQWRAEEAQAAVRGFLGAAREAVWPMALLRERLEGLRTAIAQGICAMGHRTREAFAGRWQEALARPDLVAFGDACCQLLYDLLPREGPARSKNAQTIAALRQYIQRNLAQDLSLTRLADVMGLSTSYLSRIFKEETQTNLIDYITSERFERARQLIEQTDMTIASITLQVGYPTHHYFSKRFKERYGVSPKDHRRAFCISQAEHAAGGKELTI